MTNKATPIPIHELLKNTAMGRDVSVMGWVKTKRISKQVFFINVQDGSSLSPLQLVGDPTAFDPSLLKRITVGSSLSVQGKVVMSSGKKQSKELHVTTLDILGDAPTTYPLQPKWHSLEFLRSIQHLRMRTTTFQAIFRIRHALSHTLQDFFHQRDFYWLHTPIMTSEDAEGAGQVFSVLSEHEGRWSDTAFFGKKMTLTVSGQLAAEAGALALGKVYTFGPTFRAENSNTKRHLAEFWMLEPEMAFYNLSQTVDVAEASVKHALAYVLHHCQDALEVLNQRAHKAAQRSGSAVPPPLQTQLSAWIAKPFVRITYTEALDLLKKTTPSLPPIPWGQDLQTSHERSLTAHMEGGVVVTDYPKDIKAFYMRQNDDGNTVAAMDILMPRIGEIIGGSEREERLPQLQQAMAKVGMASKADWYLDTRRFGSVPHSGFGLGFERLVLLATGMDNIRDVIPFPRTPGSAMG